MLTVRPKVAELTFQLYGRPLHPELFQVFETCTIERGAVHGEDRHHQRRPRGDVALCGADVDGSGGLGPPPAAENAAAALLRPEGPADRPRGVPRRRLLPDEFSARADRRPRSSGPSSRNWPARACGRACLHRFDSSGRIALGALSYINLEARNRSLLVQAFHTFPDDYAIVKSQSLFQLP